MKRLFKQVVQFFYLLFNFRRYVKMRKVERDLKQAVANQRVDKIIYIDKINRDMRKALKIDAHSKYIPDDIKNKAEVKAMLEARHGEQMNILNIRITDDLRLV